MNNNSVCGSIPSIIRNGEGLYVGNLRRYYQVILYKSTNLRKPYHNYRHMFHVLWLCYQACKYYQDVHSRHLVNRIVGGKRGWRNLLIAAVFHDFNHCGKLGNDHENITRSIQGFLENIDPRDKDYQTIIIDLIKATEFPHTIPTGDLNVLGKIIRDADVAQALNPAWVQQVIFGLGEEFGKSPVEMFKMQEKFLRSIKFDTQWACDMFPQEAIEAKITEANDHIGLLEPIII